MVVRDEAERLEDCLRSVEGFVDDIVVVDTGSVDGTPAIAQRCGARVHHLPWPGDFAPARNHALALARGNWVLVLDADERLRPEARQPLQALMAAPDLLLITLLRRELGAVQSPYSSVSRLFRRLEGIQWSGAYHAMVDDSVAARRAREPHWRLAACPVPAIDHDGYRPELLASSGKAARLRAAMEAELAERPGDPYACAKLGALEVSEGRQGRGIALLKLGLARCPTTAHNERFELLLHLAIALAASDGGRAADLYGQALALPLDGRLTLAARLNLAALRLAAGDAAAAAALAEDATMLAPEVACGWSSLGLARRRQGRLPEAIAAYRQAIDLAPSQPEYHQNLAAALLLAGDIVGARRGFRTAISLLEGQGQAAVAADLARRVGAMVNLDDA